MALGYPTRIMDMQEGTEASVAAIEVYSQTRDELLRDGEWSFAYGYGAPPLLKGPPPMGGYSLAVPWSSIYPLSPWLYEYGYPADCIEVRDVTKTPAQIPNLRPKPVQWRVDNDLVPVLSGPVPPIDPNTGQYTGPLPTASGPPQRVIYCNEPAPLLIYTRRVIDPTLWAADFITSLVEALQPKLAPLLADSAGLTKLNPAERMAAAATAQQHQG
jgi:hypothetical protein